jgi:hypothetical protein
VVQVWIREQKVLGYCSALENVGLADMLIGGIWPFPEGEWLEALPGERPVDPIYFFGKIVSDALRARHIVD